MKSYLTYITIYDNIQDLLRQEITIYDNIQDLLRQEIWFIGPFTNVFEIKGLI